MLKSKKMQQKQSRKMIGNFSEVNNFIRSITQLIYNHIKDFDDPYWIWLLRIRKFLRFMLMPQLTESQVKAMGETLENLMNIRLHLTRIIEPSTEKNKNTSRMKKIKVKSNIFKGKHDPSVKWKEHYLGHFEEDIRQLAPLPLLNTDLFESKE